jgi:hypothetical protein
MIDNSAAVAVLANEFLPPHKLLTLPVRDIVMDAAIGKVLSC